MKKWAVLLVAMMALGAASYAWAWQVAGESKVSGLGHPESVAYDPGTQSLYVSLFGPEFKPLQKDAKGSIARLDLSGKVLEERFLPAEGQVLHKPKGVWVAGGRLWTTDIDSVWVFDLASKQGRRVELPGAKFANDPVVIGDRLYVSDMAGDRIYQVMPADFLNAEPQISILLEQKGLSPNGLSQDSAGGLLIASSSKVPAGAIYRLQDGKAQAMSKPLGGLDGLAVLDDGTILFTDWVGGGLFLLEKGGNAMSLSTGFKGPADFGLAPNPDGVLVVVPDLATGEVRFIRLNR